MPQATLKAVAAHGAVADVLPRDGAATLVLLGKAGVNVAALADKLQGKGADAFVQSWRDLLQAIAAKSKALS
jgi:transaldolase